VVDALTMFVQIWPRRVTRIDKSALDDGFSPVWQTWAQTQVELYKIDTENSSFIASRNQESFFSVNKERTILLER
jgi:hypothetical protein